MVDAQYEMMCPAIAPIFGYFGVIFATVLSNMGAAYGTAKAGVGIMKAGVLCPELIWKNLIPIIMAGVNGIYGLITAIIILNNIASPNVDGFRVYSLYTGFGHLAAGLSCGLCGLASGMCIGISGDSGIRAFTQVDYMSKNAPRKGLRGQMASKKKGGGAESVFVGSVLIQVFGGNLALYGMITAIILTQTYYQCEDN
ncbi:hypothetical protein TrST_g4792 [Triparma strigata]|uniref:V-type proton ATPase proteolipid subunit n=1 Tax=Triparma strigata TaxID=1606541 RepID=A0A9W7EPY6_9STRA|nr:hypothetical protein TrST_g4792 [Triparma strigata]